MGEPLARAVGDFYRPDLALAWPGKPGGRAATEVINQRVQV